MYKDNKELQDETREEDEMISNILTLTNLYMMNRIIGSSLKRRYLKNY